MANNSCLRPVSDGQVRIRPSFFQKLMDLAADRIIPYQWEALNDNVEGAAPSYCIRNFRAAAGEIDMPHAGFVFQDSDLAKWIEAASYMLTWRRDPETEKHIDETVDLIGRAQLPDGYLDTYYILTGIDKRWTNLRDNHEMYCAGHMLEAAVAYFKATGKRKLLDIMLKFVDHIAERFGPEEGKKRGYPGHEELELALVKLYEVTNDPKHLALAKFFIDERGTSPLYFSEECREQGRGEGWLRSVYAGNTYYQAGAPVREQTAALGHAVRQGYLLSGMADVARESGDDSLKAACDTMWKDITRRQMYITGAVGQSSYGEAFTFDYDLPNDLVYGETCASISMVFFAQRMLRMDPRGEYADIIDKMLYNGTISGMNLQGNRFFYVNPLESWPERNRKNQQFTHVESSRQKWFGCACCPPNLARMIAALPGSILYARGNTAYLALFSSFDSAFGMDGGRVKLSCETDYPWSGRVTVKVDEAFPGFTLALRLPGWVKSYRLTVNGETPETVLDEGFLYLSRPWQSGDEIVFDMDMPVCVMRAHPRVRANSGKIALQRGPVVYCLEEVDNGANLSAVRLNPAQTFDVRFEKDLLGGVTVIDADALRQTESGWDEYELYGDAHAPVYEPFRARFVPYYAWNNRGEGEMTVWVGEAR